MDANLINEIAKAKRFAEEPERIQFTKFETTFRGENDIHTVTYDKGVWHCTCRFFHDYGDCSHTMAMMRILGVTVPAANRQRMLSELQNVLTELKKGSSIVNIQNIRIRITQTPLTLQNVAITISAIVELYTKCWLMVRGRYADLIEYTQTRNSRFTEEANLVISKITYNSPLSIDMKIDASPQALIHAFAEGIDAIAHAPQRVERAKLDNQTIELEMKLKELDAKSSLADKEQARQIAAEKAELEKQTALLVIERHRLENIEYELNVAGRMVDIFLPNADLETRAMYLRTFFPNLFQLGGAIGLELALPVPQNRTR